MKLNRLTGPVDGRLIIQRLVKLLYLLCQSPPPDEQAEVPGIIAIMANE